MSRVVAACVAITVVVLAGCRRHRHHLPPIVPEAADPAEVAVGERLFLETRFAQFFAANFGGDVNAPLAAGDPTLDLVTTADGTQFTGPFAGLSMNCRQCHFVDEFDGVSGGGLRTYGDFARRSPVPDRGDGRTATPRNAPPLVNASIARDAEHFLHFDGEFVTTEELVRSTLTGRNYGWRADETAAAIAHVAQVVREDDGTGALAGDFGGVSYADTFAAAATVPEELLLPASFQLDVTTASDAQILDAVAALITAYVVQLEHTRADDGSFTGSPFDRFLEKNDLPAQPDPGESNEDYTLRLGTLIDALASPQLVAATEGSFVHHDQEFLFADDELEGLRIFFRKPATLPPGATELAQGGIGNCIACHFGPGFSDFELHNVGTAQDEYDNVHGAGGFLALAIPDLATRDGDVNQFLPPSAANPNAEGVFLRVPTAGDARFADLGVWNVFANANLPAPQADLATRLCELSGLPPASCTPANLLPFAIGVFKTPGLRDLADGAPYMHTGQFDELEDVLGHYLLFSDLARAGAVRNADPELSGIALNGGDLAPLAAFLRSLTQDYD